MQCSDSNKLKDRTDNSSTQKKEGSLYWNFLKCPIKFSEISTEKFEISTDLNLDHLIDPSFESKLNL